MALALLAALPLGLRHATDPDHLTAVTTLVMSDERHGARRAARLGLAWGLGHALTLLLLGLPVVVFDSFLPEPVQQAAEVAVGLFIAGLAVRLLLRWRRGCFHTQGDGRTPVAAFGIGLVHGVGGSAGAGILIVGAVPGTAASLAALLVFALGTAISMAVLSNAFGHALKRGPLLVRVRAAVPAFGAASVLFGAWYALGALNAVPYAF